MFADILKLMAFCLVATIVIETLLAIVFFKIRRGPDILIVVLAQVATNPVVELVVGILYPAFIYQSAPDLAWTSYIVIVVMELAAFAVEGFIYSKAEFKRPYLMSLVLNLTSVTIGFLLPI